MRSDKPKFNGSFVGQACSQRTLKDKPVKFKDKFGEWRYGKVASKTSFNWVWNGSEWVTESQYNPKPTTVEEWLKHNKITKY